MMGRIPWGGVLPHFPITSKSKFPTLSTLSQWNDMGEEFLRGGRFAPLSHNFKTFDTSLFLYANPFIRA